MDYKWKKLILVVNFLIGLRVNEIPNETFILDSHWSFLCTGGRGGGWIVLYFPVS